jgi:acyl carrier protein
MKRNNVLQELSAMLDIDASKLVETTDLSELGWDSLTNLAFMSFADSQFNTVIAPKDLSAAKSVADILNLISIHIED